MCLLVLDIRKSRICARSSTRAHSNSFCFQLYDHIIKYHHEKLRMSGYHEFYRATLVHKGLPLYTVSLWNTVIFCIQTIMQQQYGPEFFNHCTKSVFSPTCYVVMFCAFETVILLIIHGTYIQRVVRFNRAGLPPDVFRGLSASVSSVSPRSRASVCSDCKCSRIPQVGVTTRDAETSDLLEKQADLINYLKDHNNKLNQKLMALSAQVKAASGNASMN